MIYNYVNYLFYEGLKDLTVKKQYKFNCNLKYINFNKKYKEIFKRNGEELVYENTESRQILMIYLDLVKRKLIYTSHFNNVVFNPSKGYMLYFNILEKKRKFFGNLVITIKFSENKIEKMKFKDYFVCNFNKKEDDDKLETGSYSYYLKGYMDFCKSDDISKYKFEDFNLVNINKSPYETRRDIAKKIREDSIKNGISKNITNNYIKNDYLKLKVRDKYNRDYPHEMFAAFTDYSKKDVHHVYINEQQYLVDISNDIRDVNNVFVFYYSPKLKRYGIRYIEKKNKYRYIENKENNKNGNNLKKESREFSPNPTVKKDIYLKILGDMDNMDPQLVDFYTNDHFMLYRLWYNLSDIAEKRDIYVECDAMNQIWTNSRNSYYSGDPTWRDREFEKDANSNWRKRKRYDNDLDISVYRILKNLDYSEYN